MNKYVFIVSGEYCNFYVRCLKPKLQVKYYLKFFLLQNSKKPEYFPRNLGYRYRTETFSTLHKAIDNGNLSLENIQNRNPTLKTIKMQLKLVRWGQKCNFQTNSCIL